MEAQKIQFESISAVFRALGDAKPAKGAGNQSRTSGGKDWCDWSYDEICARGRAGGSFPEFNSAESLPVVPSDKLPLTIGDDWAEVEGLTGGYVDLDAFFEGDPECMMMEQELPVEGKALRFGISAGGSCLVQAAAFKNRARVLAAYIEQLELRGISCEIWIVMCVGDAPKFTARNMRASMAICAKQAGETLRPEVIGFILDPSFFRRVFMKFMETRGDLNDLTQEGYGYPQCGEKARASIFSSIAPMVDHWIPEIDSRGAEYATVEKTIDKLAPIFNRDWTV